MPGFLARLQERLRRPRTEGGCKRYHQLRRIVAARFAYDTPASFYAALGDSFVDAGPLRSEELALLLGELRGMWGAERAVESDELDEYVAFWELVSAATGTPEAAACAAEGLLLQGSDLAASNRFHDALAAKPALLGELRDDYEVAAGRAGGDAWLRYRVDCLEALTAGEGDDDEAASELYGALLDEFAGDPDALAQLHSVGRHLEEAVSRGDLPRTLVRRGHSRHEDEEL